jgi:hypothetical protein
MATPSMLRECNTREREGKMRFLRLTVLGAFARLQLKGAGSERPARGAQRKGLTTRPEQWAVGLAMLGLGLAGCAGVSVDSSPQAKQGVVAERAQARWQILMKGDVEGAYQFLSAGSKAATSLEAYKSKIRPGMWRGAKVDKVECQAEICKVVMQITYDARAMKGIQTPVDETWVIENGSAWYIYR